MRKICLTLAAVFICSAATAKFDEAFKYDHPKRGRLIDSIIKAEQPGNPNSSLQFINGLRQLALEHNDQYATLTANLLVLLYHAGSPAADYAGIKAEADSCADDAARRHFPGLAAGAWRIFADFCYRRQLYLESFTATFKAYENYKSVSVADYPVKRQALYYMALLYYRFKDYSHALDYCREALQEPATDPSINLWANDLAGMCCLKTGHAGPALSYFRLTKQAALAQQTNDAEAWSGIADGNTAMCYEQAGNYTAAIPLFKEGIARTAKQYFWDNASSFLVHLTSIYLKEGLVKDAAALIPDARQATFAGGDEDTRSGLYTVLSDYNTISGDSLSGLRFRDSATYWRDSLGRRLNQNLKTQAELNYAEERYRTDTGLLNDKLRMQRLIRNGILLLSLAGLLIGILLIWQRRQQIRLLTFKAERQALELQQARHRLRQIAESVDEKNALIEKIEELPQPVNLPATDQQAGLLEELRKSVILTKDDWADFQVVFEQAYPGVIAGLQDACPKCTPSEFRLMMLDKLALNNKAMAAMLGVSQETIRSTRSRLNKKTRETDKPDGAE